MNARDLGIDSLDIAHAPDRSDVEADGFELAVEREEEKILREEGKWHVAGIYLADEEDASKLRTLLAQRIVREKARDRARGRA